MLFATMLSAWVLLALAGGAVGIKVKFGTNDGPIVPPTPEPKVVPVPPFKEPAPVWEPQPDDLPDPTATWRPLFVPNPLFTKIAFKQPQPPTQTPQATTHTQPPQIRPSQPPAPPAQQIRPSQPPAPPAQQIRPAQPPSALTSAQRFVNAYLPRQPTNAPQYQNGGQTLSSQSIPGLGLRYFAPTRAPQAPAPREDELNRLDADDQYTAASHDALLVYEKETARRARNSLEGYQTQPFYYYQWPVYFPHNRQY